MQEQETDYIEMAFDEIDSLNKKLEKYAKTKGFKAGFVYDDDGTYLSIYPSDDKIAQTDQRTIPSEALELVSKIAKSSKSDLVIQTDNENGYQIWVEKSPMCINSQESYENICDYCDFVKSVI